MHFNQDPNIKIKLNIQFNILFLNLDLNVYQLT